MRRPRADYDTPWKEIIERLFPHFVQFFFPEAYEEINWSRGYEFLDKELQQVVRRSKGRRRVVDKLVKVWLKSGEEVWVLIHVEVQGQKDAGFPKRMYVYNFRIFDKYDRPVASLAILADADPNWRPSYFGYKLFGCESGLKFPAIKLLDYEDRCKELEASTNPFAMVVMAYLRTMSTQRQPQSRLEWKLRLVKWLYGRGLPQEQVYDLFRFIDWVMTLPEGLEQQFEEEIEKYEEEQKVPFISPFEQRAMDRGEQRGEQRAMRTDVIEALEIRFQHVPEPLVEAVQKIADAAVLKSLFRQAITAQSLEEFSHSIPS